MSKIFFDHLIEIDEVKIHIDNIAECYEEKSDLWDLVDEFVNNKTLSSILNGLDEGCHDEFITMFLNRPYDVEIINYLDNKLRISLEELLQEVREETINDLYGLLGVSRTEKTKRKGRKKDFSRK